MSLLPDGPIDTLGVRAHLATTADRVGDALTQARAQAFAGTDDVDSVLFVVAGPERLAVDAVLGLGGADAAVPVATLTTRRLPRWVGEDTLVVVVALADRPEIAGAVREAIRIGARVVGVGNGPIVESIAERDLPVARFGFDVPAPRHAVPEVTIALWALCTDALGLHDEIDELTERCVAQLDARAAEHQGAIDAGRTPPARRLARRLGRPLSLAYGAGVVGDLVSRRWKSMVNDDVKAAAFAGSIPAIAHHELSGFGQHGDLTRQVFTFVLVRHDHADVDDAAALELAIPLVEEVTGGRQDIVCAGDTELAQLLDGWYQVDLAAVELAEEHEVDPGPLGVDPIAILRG